MNLKALDAFHALHRGPQPLVLANAWDALSARIVQELKAPAVATSSAAMAWAHGYADGHKLPVPRLLASVEDIARVLTVPLSVDAEGGYSDDPKSVAAHISRLVDAGAVGINLED